MDAELAALASSGATALVNSMAADSWALFKQRFARLFAKRDPGRVDALESELDATREGLVRARADGDGSSATELESEWRSRLKRLLAADEGARAELRRLLSDVEAVDAAAGRTSVGTVEMNAEARGKARIYQVGHGDMQVGGGE